jgi:hypothetical protein
MAVSREALYEEVWADPMLEVATRYEVSSSYMARLCRNLGIPTPPVGYWARLRAGGSASRPKLPAARPGEDIEWERSGRPAARAPWPYPKPPEHFHRHHPIVRDSTRLHSLVQRALPIFKEVEDPAYSRDFIKIRKQAVLDVHVSRRELERMFVVVNKILMTLDSCGYEVELAGGREPLRWIDFQPEDPKKRGYCYASHWWHPSEPTIVRIGTLPIGLSFYEIKEDVLAKEVKGEWVPLEVNDEVDLAAKPKRGRQHQRFQTHNIPGGRFAVRAYSPYEGAPWEQRWGEAKRGDWSLSPPSLVQTLEQASSTIADLVEKVWRKQEADHKRWLAEREARILREELRRQEEARLEAIRKREKSISDSTNDLLGMIEGWSRAARIEAFFNDVMRRASEGADGTGGLDGSPPEWLAERIEIARELLGGTDSLARFRRWRSPEERLADGP